MDAQIPPPLPLDRSTTWWQRNWKWATSMSIGRQDMHIWLFRFPDRKEAGQFKLSLQDPPPANGPF